MLICSWLVMIASTVSSVNVDEGSFAPTRSRFEEIASLTACTLQLTDSVAIDEASLLGSRSSPELTLSLTQSLLGSRFVTDAAGTTTHWQATGRFADGQISSMTVGGLATSKAYDGLGRLDTIITGPGGAVQNLNVDFDIFGNLKARGDSASALAVETFKYDALNRLTHKGSTATAFPTLLASYDAVGNLTSKLGQGAYVYDATSKRLSSFGGNAYGYDGNGNVVADGQRTITYNAFNLPETITKGASSLAYSYDASHARVKESSPTHGSTYYAGGYELVIPADSTATTQKREERSYISTPEGTVGVITQASASNASGPASSSTDTRYWHKDHLGSLSAISNPSGTVLQRFRFDPWGVRECLSAAAAVIPCTSSSLQNGGTEERGFTGHEMLDEVGLIHMNGRLFDQTLGRFLQADPIIQEPLNSQNYNRYSYVFNNPLAYTDPSGFSAWTKVRAPLAAVAIMIVTQGMGAEFAAPYLGAGEAAGIVGNLAAEASAYASAASVQMAFTIAGGAAAGAVTGGNIESAVLGVFQAMASFGIGEFTGHGTLPAGSAAHFQNIVGHAALGCAMANAAGGSCKSGALAGGFSAAAGPVIAGLTDGNFGAGLAGRMAAGCVGSYIGKGSCEAGAVTAAFDYIYNAKGRGGRRGNSNDPFVEAREARRGPLLESRPVDEFASRIEAWGQALRDAGVPMPRSIARPGTNGAASADGIRTLENMHVSTGSVQSWFDVSVLATRVTSFTHPTGNWRVEIREHSAGHPDLASTNSRIVNPHFNVTFVPIRPGPLVSPPQVQQHYYWSK